MTRLNSFHKRSLATGLLGLLVFLGGAKRIHGQAPEELHLTVGQSIVLGFGSDIGKIYYPTPPEIIEAQPTTSRDLVVSGKTLGSSSLIVWNKAGDPTFYNVNVDLNIGGLRQLIKETFPTGAIEARTSRDTVTLAGSVNSKDEADRATTLASAFAKSVVNNLVIKSGPVERQVMLRVKFALLDRQKAGQYGFNLNSLGNGPFNTSGNATGAAGPAPLVSAGSLAQAINLTATRLDLNLQAVVQALQTENVLEVLAEPVLIASSGKEAAFTVGGEFPVPIAQGGTAGAVSVAYREFGTRLKFTPTITTNNTIKLVLQNEVSALDFANGVQLNGFRIPALSTRKAETQIELSDGQSYIVAGLLDRRATDSWSQIPIAASLPVLGALFKTKNTSKQITELIVMVTPEITQPLNQNEPSQQPLFPVELMKRLELKDVQPAKGTKKKAKG